MDVHLLIYDLSGGLARQMSRGMLGFQLDAIYHTSIKLDGREYVYDGGVLSIVPGSSHLGRPLEEMYLGRTELPMDVVEEYLDSLRDIYTAEAYNLWTHNCNNFSNDFATFLTGHGIPDHIAHMPRAVLDSPLGQMLVPALNQQVNRNRQNGGILGIQDSAAGSSAKPAARRHHHEVQVRKLTSVDELVPLLRQTESSCAVIFFTSVDCAPCKTLYTLYDELAAEVGNKGVLMRVDIGQAFDIAARFSVSTTPTFITFLKGQQENKWVGADPSALRGNVQLLVQMAWPPHPHDSLNMLSFHNADIKPVLFAKVPPLEKLMGKMGQAANTAAVQGVKRFIEARSRDGPAQASLPDIGSFAEYVRQCTQGLPTDSMFPVIDLMRCGLVDPRFSGYLAEEKKHRTVLAVFGLVNGLSDCPYPLRLVTLQMACNLFSSPLYPDQILSDPSLRPAITQFLSTSFLDDNHNNIRVAAASLLFNIALTNGTKRTDGPGDLLPEDDQVELAASVLEAITQEESSKEALEGMLLALGYLVYRLPLDSQLADLLRTMDAADTIVGKKKQFPDMKLINQVGELLGKGLETPKAANGGP